MNDYLAGEAIYGDDFGPDEIEAWFAEEAEAYVALGAGTLEGHSYGYHALNIWHGFRHLPEREFGHALAFGGALGEELGPILPRVGRVTIVEPSAAFIHDEVDGKPVTYVKPHPSGELELPAASVDLVTCFGVLHHIPNVSAVVGELARVLAPEGFLLLREPIVSMGDWRAPRPGLTRHERGIPLVLLRTVVRESSLHVVREALCDFPLIARAFRGPGHPYNSRRFTRVDSALSRLFAWNVNYHPRATLQRLRPRAVFYVLDKS